MWLAGGDGGNLKTIDQEDQKDEGLPQSLRQLGSSPIYEGGAFAVVPGTASWQVPLEHPLSRQPG